MGITMNIVFSRHARRRMKLYKIPEHIVVSIVEEKGEITTGKNEFIKAVDGFKYPVKVVVRKEQSTVFVITAYLLKRGTP